MNASLLVVAALFAALLFVTAYYWRAFLSGIPFTPFRSELRRAGMSLAGAQARVGSLELRTAETRCALCASRALCAARFARGEAAPDYCPNASVKKQLGLRTR